MNPSCATVPLFMIENNNNNNNYTTLVVTFPNTLRQLLASDSRHPGDMRLPRLPGRYQRIWLD